MITKAGLRRKESPPPVEREIPGRTLTEELGRFEGRIDLKLSLFHGVGRIAPMLPQSCGRCLPGENLFPFSGSPLNESRHSVCEKGARGIQATAKKFQELSFGGLKGLLKGGSLAEVSCTVMRLLEGGCLYAQSGNEKTQVFQKEGAKKHGLRKEGWQIE